MAAHRVSRGWLVVSAWIAAIGSGVARSAEAPKAPAPQAKPTATKTAVTQPALNALEQEFLASLTEGKKEPSTLRAMAQALVASTNPRVTEALAKLLRSATVAATRVAICEAVADAPQGGAAHAAFVAPLLDLLGHEAPAVRAASIRALARHRAADVPQRLGQIAGDAARPVAHRVAALDVLDRMHRAEAMAALVPLVGDKAPAIRQRVLAILRSHTDASTSQRLGRDPAAWQKWWAANGSHWAAHRLTQLAEELEQVGEEQALLLARLRSALRELYNRTTNGEKQKLHASWFADRNPGVRGLAVDLLKENYAETKHGAASMVGLLRGLIADPAASVRTGAVELVGYLKEPNDAKALLAQLAVDQDAAARAAIVKALGQIRDVSAVPALIAGLNDASRAVVLEAATALGGLGRKGEATAAAVKPAVKALGERFQAAARADPGLTATILRAMAQIADPSFATHFAAYAEHADAGLREAAIRGVAQLGDAAQLPLLIAHLKDAAPAVRQAAAEGVGAVGRNQAALEPLLPLLDAGESEAVRGAAWTAIKTVAGRLDVDAQRQFGERVRTMPARYVELMTPVEKTLASRTPPPAELADLREKLGDAQVAVGQHADAEKQYENAHTQLVAAKQAARAAAVALKRVDSLLRLSRFEMAMTFAAAVTGNPDATTAETIAMRVQAFLEQCLDGKQPKLVIDLHPHLAKHLYPKIGKAWPARFDAALGQARTARVAALLPALIGEPPARAAAEQEIKAMGKPAVALLAAQLHTLVAAKPPNPALEQAVFTLLKTLAGDAWPGYDAKATPDAKQAAIKPLLGK